MPGLFLVGEILDVDGRIGGFNFQWAWSSGFVAGRALAGGSLPPKGGSYGGKTCPAAGRACPSANAAWPAQPQNRAFSRQFVPVRTRGISCC